MLSSTYSMNHISTSNFEFQLHVPACNQQNSQYTVVLHLGFRTQGYRSAHLYTVGIVSKSFCFQQLKRIGGDPGPCAMLTNVSLIHNKPLMKGSSQLPRTKPEHHENFERKTFLSKLRNPWAHII